ncbi:MAG: hypothetical protein ACI4EX_06710 [Lachnospiraceae bacterium]
MKIAQSEGNVSFIFCGCSSLTTLDLSGFVTRDIIDMHDMFAQCSSLTTLDISKFDTDGYELYV